MPHPLDNVIWNALTGPQAELAIGNALARRFPPSFAPFAAMPEPSPANFHALAALASPGDRLALDTVADVSPTEEFVVEMRKDMVQMIFVPTQPIASHARMPSLGDGDAADMLALAQETQPGPFSERTRELGRFFGVRVDGRLVAMAGERLRVNGFTEVSAVCTLASHRGKGYGRDLVLNVVEGIVARGETPFLHAFGDNLAAISVYRKLGFEVRRVMRLTVLTMAAAGSA
jgi:predicted GNAT family acetyltransferase